MIDFPLSECSSIGTAIRILGALLATFAYLAGHLTGAPSHGQANTEDLVVAGTLWGQGRRINIIQHDEVHSIDLKVQD